VGNKKHVTRLILLPKSALCCKFSSKLLSIHFLPDSVKAQRFLSLVVFGSLNRTSGSLISLGLSQIVPKNKSILA
jgi:hypothetical protein